MPITFNEENKTFLLRTSETAYAMQVSKLGYLLHIYWGKDISNIHPENVALSKFEDVCPQHCTSDIDFPLDSVPLEYPSYGNSDFRIPAFEVKFADGSRVCVPKFKSYKIVKGKKKLTGLPSLNCEKDDNTETLLITLEDDLWNFEIVLSYTIFYDYNVITRSTLFKNNGEQDVTLLKALSMSVDFLSDDFDMLQLSGSWARERHPIRRPLAPGLVSIESRRGASSPQQNPFTALLSKGVTENYGDVFAVNLIYSGNFFAGAEVDQQFTSRFSIGINPFEFEWILSSGESFETPEAVMVYSDSGLGKMSRTYHKIYRERLCRSKYRLSERPIIANNWEATYFDFNSEKLLTLAKKASELGVELFVLDDGWFGKRNNDDSSLGDWFENKEKLPKGLRGLSKDINSLGLKFGLWVEPEMISKDSELYKSHPDWCIHVENRVRSEIRHQLVLDLTRKDVRDAIIEMLTNIFSNASISYVKWDMNRNITEACSEKLSPSHQGEIFHRYILGLYEIFETITTKFPDILFESCASGGGRFDPGMLYYMPQTWTSDDTDAIERLKIQYGTSLVYPSSSIAAHVSAVPNAQVGRVTPIKTRGLCAMQFNFGYELDFNKCSDSERDEIKNQISFYKTVRPLVQYGDLYRLRNPFCGNNSANIYVSQDKTEAFAVYVNILGTPNVGFDYLKFDGLAKDKVYTDLKTGKTYGGDELMNVGLPVSVNDHDFDSCYWHFKVVK